MALTGVKRFALEKAIKEFQGFQSTFFVDMIELGKSKYKLFAYIFNSSYSLSLQREFL